MFSTDTCSSWLCRAILSGIYKETKVKWTFFGIRNSFIRNLKHLYINGRTLRWNIWRAILVFNQNNIISCLSINVAKKLETKVPWLISVCGSANPASH